MSRDFDSTLEKIRAIGYEQLEMVRFFARSRAKLESSPASVGLRSAYCCIETLNSSSEPPSHGNVHGQVVGVADSGDHLRGSDRYCFLAGL
jgi:hypothetical protein